MRILFFSNVFPNPYQPTKGLFNLRLMQALAAQHEVRVICPVSWIEECRACLHGRPAPLTAGVARTALFPRYYYPPKLLRNAYGQFLWRSVRSSVERTLASFAPDVVLAYWAHPDGYVAERIAGTLGVPAVIMTGGTDILLLTKDAGRRSRIVDVLSAAEATVVVGEHLRGRLLELGVSADKIHVVPRGVDATLFHPGDRGAARRALGIAADVRMLLWVGRLVPVKGLDVLVEACRQLRERGERFHLYLVGGGELDGSLRWTIASFGLDDCVSLVGPVLPEALGDWYRAANLTVLPSRSEGVPNVLRESLACGTPFVASNVGGVREVDGGASGRLVPAGDPQALARAITEALGAPAAAVSPRNQSWEESAAALGRVLQPLVAKSWDANRPWWVSGTADSAAQPATGEPWRQRLTSTVKEVMPRGLFTCRERPESGAVYLTFDDGPHPEHTPRLLDVLAEFGVPATFFVIGRLAERHPDLVRRIAAEGHAVGNHSFFHAPAALTSTRRLLNEVRLTNIVLEQILGRRPELFRPPFGKLTPWRLFRLRRSGIKIILWNVDPKDYRCRSAADLAQRLHARPLAAGDIVLFHDRLPWAADVLPEMVARTREQGMKFHSLGDEVSRGNRQPTPFAPTVA